jgi:hypothetical protein
MPNNHMGMEENITTEKFEAAAEAMGMSAEESRQNALELLKKVIAADEVSTEKNWKP